MPALDSAGGSATGSAGDPAHSGVDKQCADAGGGRYLALQDLDMVGQITAFEPGVGQYHDGIQNMITLKNRQEGKVFAFASTASHFPPGRRRIQPLRAGGRIPHSHFKIPPSAFRLPTSKHLLFSPLPHSDFRIRNTFPPSHLLNFFLFPLPPLSSNLYPLSFNLINF
jgi:hypothetical protein